MANFGAVLMRPKSAPLNLIVSSKILSLEDVTIPPVLSDTIVPTSTSLTRFRLFS
ncbi:hypothetical protein FA13DRAFT_1736358 [Coprinellus micaceus]|uniref:Uncharacterized protein n=1 Tax=Coprinellus micaceus TaxID=71717 RepID=A0A4Y7T060_COPMI|nr:hypothetical protein FA13DRAFT_1736358 [Coprinellus micaceus]